MWPLVGQACWIVRTVEGIVVQSRLVDSFEAILILHPLTRELIVRLLALVRQFASHVAARPAVGSDMARAVLDDMVGGSASTPRLDGLLAIMRLAAESTVLDDAGALNQTSVR